VILSKFDLDPDQIRKDFEFVFERFDARRPAASP